MRINNLFAVLAVTFACAIAPVVAHAGGPKDIQNPATRTPFKYKAPVKVYTDLGNLGIVSNAAANAQVAAAFKQWTDVPTSSFEASVVGDVSAIGLGDITAANVGQVIGTFNAGGTHVIYDTDGSILRNVFGVPGSVLGIATPEYVVDGTDEVVESWAIMNGRGVPAGDTTGAKFAGVMTHEFGHAIGLAHSQTNGAILLFGDSKGPFGTTSLPYSGSPVVNDLETMYPFINPATTGIAQATVDHPDDIMAISDLYPAPGWPENYGTITGTITSPDGQQITGVNVIARNIANPWKDAVSALSGDYTQGELGPDGLYTFHGLTPGAQYVVYVDSIVSGGFSTPPAKNLPGPEEFYSGANEGTDPDTDLVGSVETITAGAGVTYTADIAFNTDEGAPQLEFLGDNISPVDITADGSTIVGLINTPEAPTWRWTRDGGFEVLGGIGSSSNVSISSDGSKIVSTYRDENGVVRPGIWQGGTTWSPVPLQADAFVNSGTTLGSGWGVSDNGDITGLSYISQSQPRAYRYDAATNTTVSLATPAPFNVSRGSGITEDGSTVYGYTAFGFRFGAVWRDGVLTPVGTNARPAGEVLGASGDGQVFVGGNLALEGTQAYRWTFAGGIEPIGSLPYPGTNSFTAAQAANYDGSVIVGWAGPNNNRRGFIWTRQTGIMNIDDFLRAQGTFIQREWYLANPYALSHDGRTIVGWGVSATSIVGFRLDIPKVKICHAPPGNPNNAHTIQVAFPEGIEDHLTHGDTLGECECEDEGNGNGNGNGGH